MEAGWDEDKEDKLELGLRRNREEGRSVSAIGAKEEMEGIGVC